MKKNDFPKQHHTPPYPPDQRRKREPENRDECRWFFLGGKSKLDLVLKITPSCIFKCWLEIIEHFLVVIQYHVLLFDRTVIRMEKTFPPDKQFPFKSTHNNNLTNNNSGILSSYLGVRLICLSDLLIINSHNHKADAEFAQLKPVEAQMLSKQHKRYLPDFPRRLRHHVPHCHEMLFSVFDET